MFRPAARRGTAVTGPRDEFPVGRKGKRLYNNTKEETKRMGIEKLEAELRREKRRQERQNKEKRQGFWLLGLFFLLALGLAWAFWRGPLKPRSKPQILEAAASEASLPGETARIRLLDVGQGLGILIESGGEAMLIDGGGGEASSKTVATLKALGISRLKYILLTHYDTDHIGGAIGVLETLGAEAVLGPEYETDSRSFRSLKSRLEAAGQPLIHPAPGTVLSLGFCECLVLGPLKIHENENDNSLAVRITDGVHSLLVSGDAESAGEAELAEAWGRTLKSDIYVIGHHGSFTSSTEAFLARVKPAFLLLSCGAENEYGHPHEQARKRLEKTGAALWRTDRQGDILLFWTEEGIIWEKEAAAW